jgi:hypothetical protein
MLAGKLRRHLGQISSPMVKFMMYNWDARVGWKPVLEMLLMMFATGQTSRVSSSRQQKSKQEKKKKTIREKTRGKSLLPTHLDTYWLWFFL